MSKETAAAALEQWEILARQRADANRKAENAAALQRDLILKLVLADDERFPYESVFVRRWIGEKTEANTHACKRLPAGFGNLYVDDSDRLYRGMIRSARFTRERDTLRAVSNPDAEKVFQNPEIVEAFFRELAEA